MLDQAQLTAQAQALATSAPLVRTEVQSFMAAQGFTQVVKVVRENSNKYPYITFITAGNVAENIYFSKGASELVTAGTPIVKGFFSEFCMVQASTANNGLLWKIARKGEGNSLRAEASDLF